METLINESKKVYQHLFLEEREEIACLLEKGLKKKEIAQKFKMSPSTISKSERPKIHELVLEHTLDVFFKTENHVT